MVVGFLPPTTASTVAEMAVCGEGGSKSPRVAVGNPLKSLLLIIRNVLFSHGAY